MSRCDPSNFTLINGSSEIDEEIWIEKGKRIVPETGVPEIDIVLKESLQDTKDFRARLIFKSEYLRLIVITSPWLGRRYGKHVEKGFEMFRKIKEALSVKYPHRRLEGLEMRWNGQRREFEPVRIAG
jgi:hypothetical protein